MNVLQGQILRAAIVFFLAAAWSPPVRAEDVTPAPGCQGLDDGLAVVAGRPITWKNKAAPADHEALRSWCQGVGPPVFMDPPPRQGPETNTAVDELFLVSWNTRVGSGELDRFIKDLRSGRFNHGRPVPHFVLLLQEVFRRRSDVGSTEPEDERADIVDTAVTHELALFYVPSMRNGRPGDDRPLEDQGSAVLSNIPLSLPMAVELPLERQRRVAISASVSGRSRSGVPWTVQLINVHLENRARWGQVLRSFGKARLNQITALLEEVEGEAPAVLAGDLNTWFRETGEPAVCHVRKAFNRPSAMPKLGTVKLGSILPERIADYMFFRVPENWQADYQRVDGSYGSDHYPLVGRIRIVD